MHSVPAAPGSDRPIMKLALGAPLGGGWGLINMEIIFCPNFEKKYGRLVKEIWSDFSVLLRKFPGFLLLGP